MHPYELMFIMHPSLEQPEQEAMVERVKALIETGKGTITEVKLWGKRRLAYEIADQREGFYVLVNYEAEPHVSKEIDRVLRIAETVIRFMIVRTDES
ncbi:MAG: 30S ribosomal protein S6 [Symbiobacteriaceae bacterium]|nr:30S ribosomal protein S6 [Symbiobacteriaceae bacterium]